MEGRPRVAGGANQPEPGHDHTDLLPPRARAGALPAGARLVIIGGRFEADNRAVFEAMRELSGGRIAVLPTASGEPREAGEEARDSFRAYGIASEVVPLDKDNYRTAAFDPSWWPCSSASAASTSPAATRR